MMMMVMMMTMVALLGHNGQDTVLKSDFSLCCNTAQLLWRHGFLLINHVVGQRSDVAYASACRTKHGRFLC